LVLEDDGKKILEAALKFVVALALQYQVDGRLPA
jgi:hypothetical protein